MSAGGPEKFPPRPLEESRALIGTEPSADEPRAAWSSSRGPPTHIACQEQVARSTAKSRTPYHRVVAAEDTVVFHNDDGGYEDWVRRHNGYVLTTRDKGAYMLHDCECMHLAKDKDGTQVTLKPRRCGSRPDLVAWTQAETGTDPQKCRTCM
jgi:hypothetical protein